MLKLLISYYPSIFCTGPNIFLNTLLFSSTFSIPYASQSRDCLDPSTPVFPIARYLPKLSQTSHVFLLSSVCCLYTFTLVFIWSLCFHYPTWLSILSQHNTVQTNIYNLFLISLLYEIVLIHL